MISAGLPIALSQMKIRLVGTSVLLKKLGCPSFWWVLVGVYVATSSRASCYPLARGGFYMNWDTTLPSELSGNLQVNTPLTLWWAQVSWSAQSGTTASDPLVGPVSLFVWITCLCPFSGTRWLKYHFLLGFSSDFSIQLLNSHWNSSSWSSSLSFQWAASSALSQSLL